MNVFHFILLTLTAFRLTRIVTTDDLTQPFRDRINQRFGEDSNWSTLVSCNWCSGLYVTTAVFTLDYFWTIPTVILAAISAMTIVGMIGNYDE